MNNTKATPGDRVAFFIRFFWSYCQSGLLWSGFAIISKLRKAPGEPYMTPYLRRTLVLASAFIGSCLSTLAQGKEYQPSVQDADLLKSLYTGFKQQYQQELNDLPSRNRKDFQELYADRWKNIAEKFDKQEIYTAVAAQRYLDTLLYKIVDANPILKASPFHCYFSRSYIPNASYIGEGVILFNMGLFDRLDDESQVVFILCHEIAHYILKHQENSMEKYVMTMNSAEVQSQLRKIKGTEYHQKQQLEQLVKGLSFDSRRHSRDHEAQADSMGVELMRHTGFDLSGALTTLALLDGIDRVSFDTEAGLRRTFDASAYPFKRKWLYKEEGLLGGHAHVAETEISDSLKTHPSCPLRIKLLTPLVESGVNGGGSGAADAGKRGRSYLVDSVKFAMLKESFRYETIEYAFVSGEYTESLFLTLQLLKDRPSDIYLITQTGRVLNGLYQAQKAHRLSKVADLPSPDYPSNYNLLLQFVQNLYLEDIASLSYYYLSPWHPQLDDSPAFRKVYAESAGLVKQ